MSKYKNDRALRASLASIWNAISRVENKFMDWNKPYQIWHLTCKRQIVQIAISIMILKGHMYILFS